MNETLTPIRGSWPRALWAGLLSFYQPGLGQVYAGTWRLGVVLFLIATAGGILAVAPTWIAVPTPAAVAIFAADIAILGTFQLGVAIDAVRRVRRSGHPVSRPWHRSTWIAAVIVIPLSIGLQSVLVSTAGWHSFVVYSGSGMPSLMEGDYVFVDTRHYSGSSPTYGDMIVLRDPRTHAVAYMMRVVGLPGDRIQLSKGILLLNGQPVHRESAGPWEHASSSSIFAKTYELFRETLPNGRAYDILQLDANEILGNTKEYRVPSDNFFVLGDNRDNSLDSRVPNAVGFVPRANIVGQAHTIYWSSDLTRLFRRVE
ncbi:MAG: signal peptidase I [Proteobacteria bacterium]|nr:signal peptidase I [Pseudomonadota bacterium]